MHDFHIVVIGGSAGSIEALREIVAGLPPDLPAAIFVVVHLAPTTRSVLASVLNQAMTLPSVVPRDGQRIQTGRIYIAPPDYHMLIRDGIVRLSRGPRENRARPSIDVLFRSAITAGDNVTAVLLSGCLDDGVLGLTQVSHAGGFIIVQKPADALFPDLPQAGINRDHVDLQLPASDIAARIVERTYAQSSRVRPIRVNSASVAKANENEYGCPSCGGVLRQTDDQLGRFACLVGHTFGIETLLEDQASQIETALWTAARVLDERKRLLQNVAHRLSSRITQERVHEQVLQIDEQRALLDYVLGFGLFATNQPAQTMGLSPEQLLEMPQAVSDKNDLPGNGVA
ncbi:MAG TPA: chemotaxis protein CheB [Candidatus Obscuribacterales bacterium]